MQGWLLRGFQPALSLRVDVLAELLDLDRVKRTGVVEQRLGSLEDQVSKKQGRNPKKVKFFQGLSQTLSESTSFGTV